MTSRLDLDHLGATMMVELRRVGFDKAMAARAVEAALQTLRVQCGGCEWYLPLHARPGRPRKADPEEIRAHFQSNPNYQETARVFRVTVRTVRRALCLRKG